jgi:hypothetical protein
MVINCRNPPDSRHRTGSSKLATANGNLQYQRYLCSTSLATIASVAEIFAIDNTKQKCAAHTAANDVIIGRSI